MMQSILIVDDKNENLVALESLLERPDLVLLKADNGNDALRHLLKHDVALVLLDVQMPGMNGFEMAELMRRNKKTQAIPIIFVTANGDKRHLFRGYEVGAVDYLAKPIEREVLLSKVKIFLELDQQKRELETQLQEIKQLKYQNEQLLHALGDGVIAVDADGDISFVNPAIRHLFDIKPEALVGHPVADFIFQSHEGRRTAWAAMEIYAAASRQERFHRATGYYVKSGGAMHHAEVSAAPIPSPDGNFVGAVITLRAITEAGKDDLLEEMAKKNRRQTRKRVGAVLRMFDRNTGMNLGRLVNISLDGFKLGSRENLPVGSRYDISMVLPETLAGSNTLSFDAQVVWSRPAEDVPGEYRSGFRIIRINESELRVLVQLIEKY